MLTYILAGLIALALSYIFTLIIRRLAMRWGIVDQPGLDRKIHNKPVPLLGGLAIFLSVLLVYIFFSDKLVMGDLQYHHWLGVLAGAIILIIGGVLDDKYNLKPGCQIIFPILAALCVVAGGVGIEKISSPWGDGYFYFNQIKFPILAWGGSVYYFVLIADLFTILWLLGMIYTTKLLDGLDGLVSGLAAIGSLIIFVFTMTTKYFQPDIGFAALVLAGACLGFLLLNWHPAKIFLGEAGSMFLGFLLGVLAIISGGKIAIALLIMGIPILDVVWTIIRRLRAGHNPFKHSDRRHLHFRLLDSGLGVKKTVLIYYGLAAIFGLSAIWLQFKGKLMALLILSLIMLGLIIIFSYLDRKAKIT